MIAALPRFTAAAAALAALLLHTPANATVVRYLDLYEHTELSDLIVRAHTGTKVRSFVGEDGLPRIEREFQIVETYKGSSSRGASVWLRQFGGGDGDLNLLPIVGDATFQAGAEVILFLRTGDEGVVYLTALSQSKYEVVRDDGLPVVVRSFGDLAFYGGSPRPQLFAAPEDAPISLEIFETTLREIAAAP